MRQGLLYRNTQTHPLLIGVMVVIVLNLGVVYSQETSSNVSGIVKTADGETMTGASVTIVHQPTKNLYRTSTNSKGYFHFFSLKPGGPYTLTISYVGFKTVSETDLYIDFNSGGFHSLFRHKEYNIFVLQRQVEALHPVAIIRTISRGSSIGTETNITSALMKDMPTISRNIQDYARLVPQAKVYSDGGMSFAGQNNRFNAFYIDGANSIDLLGVSSSGISGGQTSSPPISVDAIEEIRIMISPFDVQYGNFTGATINAITRSGSNETKSSAWYYFRNQDMARGSLSEDSVTGKREKLPPFFNNTLGAWVNGPLIRDKLFYFTSLEWQNEEQPQPFDISDYKGNSSGQQIKALRDTVQLRYGYDPGSYDLTYNNLHALRFIAKVDWNPSTHHKFSFTYRQNDAERQTPGSLNGSNSVRFLNNGFRIATNTRFATLEWKSFFNSKLMNRFLVSYSGQRDDRQILGRPFPVIFIQDGPGNIVLGSHGASQISLFNGKNLNLVDILKWTGGSHIWSGGLDMSFSWINDLILSGYYGSYQYRSLSDFFNNGFPVRYQRTLMPFEPLISEGSADLGSKFRSSRMGFFLQDDWNISPEVSLKFGLRLDGNAWNTGYPADEYLNSVGIPAISVYYDLEGARSGVVFRPHWQVQPRLELTARVPDENVIFKIGAGVFTGHVLNMWATDLYNFRSTALTIDPSSYNLKFNPDVNTQPDFNSLGIDPGRSKGNIVLVSPGFKFPTVARMTSSISKIIARGWNVGLEFLLTKNLHEMLYRNVNILPSTMSSKEPGARNVYASSGLPPKIPMNGGNPYNTVLLIANNDVGRGYSYSLSATISSPASKRSAWVASYTYGHSEALFEPTGSSGPNLGQWNSLETVNGRNNSTRSVSDFDLRHRLYVYGMQKFSFAKGKISTVISVFYQGQSGQPYSYVYERSIVNDVNQNENYDLIYVPTEKEVQEMIFIPVSGPNGNYSSGQQKAMLENFIQSDKYLRTVRGSFSERNKARLPFTHTVDMRIQQEFVLKSANRNFRFDVVLDLFNVLNLLNREWGRIYQMTGDNISLIRFEKFTSATDLTPQYQFSFKGKPWSVQTSTAPGSSTRWIGQLGFRFYL